MTVGRIPEAGHAIRALFLVDGEHHPSAVLDAVRELEESEGLKAVGLFFLGGTEKVADLSALSSPRWELVVPGHPADLQGEFAAALTRLRPDLVADLSDLPVLDSGTRMALASLALAQGAVYRGADFEFRPPRREKVLTRPSIAVIGTGKRCGKTAVSAELARHLARWGYRPVVVAMGRGGPPEPYLVQGREVDEPFLLGELSKGLHAASDHYEDALVTGVTAVGSRRCGGGMAGQPFVTNCVEPDRPMSLPPRPCAGAASAPRRRRRRGWTPTQWSWRGADRAYPPWRRGPPSAWSAPPRTRGSPSNTWVPTVS